MLVDTTIDFGNADVDASLLLSSQSMSEERKVIGFVIATSSLDLEKIRINELLVFHHWQIFAGY